MNSRLLSKVFDALKGVAQQEILLFLNQTSIQHTNDRIHVTTRLLQIRL